MKKKIVLTLMQLKGISRKTVLNHISIPNNIDCSKEAVFQILEEARRDSKKIREYTSEDIKNAIEEAEKIQDNCLKMDIKILSFLDEGYPQLLRKSDDPPSLIYYKGDLSYINSMNAVAIIGTREPSTFGSKVANKLGESLAIRGFVDVSGLALGCDTEGHKGCLNAGGKTIAVLAGGLEKIYPAVNKKLAEEIVEKGGAIMSEYPPYANVFKGAFVDRDRIQAALSSGVMVIETREKGGTLHAVRYAGDYDRLVGCVKHTGKYSDIEQSEGNKMLVRNGKAVFIANDADLDEFCENMNIKRNELMKSQEDVLQQDEEYVQMSLFDEYPIAKGGRKCHIT
ncbi:MAG: DNA-processing protein DprA [Lachnospiraceae bacterium]|nr:DNA-processing protein DprA [Lachnospiraceae bacterium]